MPAVTRSSSAPARAAATTSPTASRTASTPRKSHSPSPPHNSRSAASRSPSPKPASAGSYRRRGRNRARGALIWQLESSLIFQQADTGRSTHRRIHALPPLPTRPGLEPVTGTLATITPDLISQRESGRGRAVPSPRHARPATHSPGETADRSAQSPRSSASNPPRSTPKASAGTPRTRVTFATRSGTQAVRHLPQLRRARPREDRTILTTAASRPSCRTERRERRPRTEGVRPHTAWSVRWQRTRTRQALRRQAHPADYGRPRQGSLGGEA